jgi:hypothetical protein
MTSAASEKENGVDSPRRGPSRLKIWFAIAMVFAAQVGVAFWLGNPPPVKHFQPATVPVIYMADDRSRDLLAINDPTLFILPHRDNFSGDAWLKMAPRKFSPTNWTEPARPLDLPREQLGATFVAFMQTNHPPRFQPRIESGLDTAEAGAAPLPPISVPSRMFVEGDLAKLRLLTPLHLPPQTNSDLLTNTVIRMVVDAQGYPYSAVIWERSGNEDADAMALTNFARAVRFSPPEAEALRTVPTNRMVSGKLVFEWQTMPPAPTNAPSGNP